jgi:transcriptional regulator with XRE-family HTH domain
MAEKNELIDNARQMYLVSLGKRIREIRQQAGLSQRRLAQAAGLTPTYMYLLEAGGPQVGILTLRDLSIALGVPVAALLEEEGTAAKMDPRLLHIGSQLLRLLDALKARTDEGAVIYQQIQQYIEDIKDPSAPTPATQANPAQADTSASPENKTVAEKVRGQRKKAEKPGAKH